MNREVPYSIEAEQNVLGSLMFKNDSFDDVSGFLAAEDFYRADHQLIFRGISEMISQRKPCDFVTLHEHAKERGTLADMGGFSYLPGS